MKKVSVIIPVYNAEENIGSTLENILNQTLKEIEVLCIDDGSVDASADIIFEISKKDERVKYIFQKNQGAGCARNKGIKEATGKYIAFMDADDQYPEQFTLEKMVNTAEEYNVKICGGYVRNIESGVEKALCTFAKEGIMYFQDYQEDSLFQRFIFERLFIIEHSLYFPPYRVYEDPVFLTKAFVDAKEFYALHEPTYNYTGAHQANNMTLLKTKDFLRGLIDNLNISSENNFIKLHKTTFERLSTQANHYVETFLYSGDQELLSLFFTANSAINRELLGMKQDYMLPGIVSMWNAGRHYMKFRNLKLIKLVAGLFNK